MAYKYHETVSRTVGLLQCAPPGVRIHASQDLRYREFFCKPATTPQLELSLITRAQLLNNVGKRVFAKLGPSDDIGSAGLEVILMGPSPRHTGTTEV